MVKKISSLLLLLCGISFFLFAAFSKKTAVDSKNKPPQKQSMGFALVELYTSEGCSSCPAADAVLEKISREFPGQVYTLGFHVDYWNRLGWEDIYSNESFTQRQQAYGRAFHLNSIYTPQVVVNGKIAFVGSDERRLREVIRQELQVPATSTLSLRSSLSVGKNLVVNYSTDNPPSSTVNIALVQRTATTSVKSGENEGRVLHHVNIVRDWKILHGKEGSVYFSLPPGVNAQEYKVIAWVAGENLKIIAASEKSIDKIDR